MLEDQNLNTEVDMHGGSNANGAETISTRGGGRNRGSGRGRRGNSTNGTLPEIGGKF